MKHKLIKQCWQDGKPFRFMDSGYLGNRPYDKNPRGWKIWHRIVDNDLQHDQIIKRPADRLERLKLPVRPYRNKGTRVLVVAPDEKPCVFYGIDQAQWLKDTVAEIKRYTDRPIVVRSRAADPDSRTRNPGTSFAAQLEDDVFCTVVFNSVAATESIVAGIACFVTCECNAARPVSNVDLSNLDKPWFPDNDLRHEWLCHLAYGQFHNDELENGAALRILDKGLE